MGLRSEAWRAGQNPKIIPIAKEKKNETRIAVMEIFVAQPKKTVIPKDKRLPIRIPKRPPTMPMTMASIKN